MIESLRQLIAEEGADWADDYEAYAGQNPEFERYWDIAIDAIRDNTVDMIVFGRECMLETITNYPLATHDPNVVLCALAVSLDKAAKKLKGETVSS